MRFRLRWGSHALSRNELRHIRTRHVQAILDQGDIIEVMSRPHGGVKRVYLGKFENRTLHVVVDVDADETEGVIVTVYVPDPKEWTNGYRERRKS
jgi:Domain of unknown function (DUF4258)